MRAKGSEWRYVNQLRVLDTEKLQAFFRALHERYGSTRGAAEWLNIDQSTFTRLRNGTTQKAIRFATYANICKACAKSRPFFQDEQYEQFAAPPFEIAHVLSPCPTQL